LIRRRAARLCALAALGRNRHNLRKGGHAVHLLITAVACTLGCASAPAPPPAAPAPPPAATAAPAPGSVAGPGAAAATATAPTAATTEAELPDGRGKQILVASCTSCHDLREVTKFRGYYTRAQWRDIVLTMVDYGADVTKADVDVLADYLNEHLGRVSAAKP